ncbi:MAG TPA: response regulator [Dehalococcoidia bacterium]|nr:response regulator [Dehalococcoidia bacterium]
MREIRVLLVEENLVLSKTIKDILQGLPYCRVIDEARNGWEALGKACVFKPDVVLMDAELEEPYGLQVASWLSSYLPGVRTVLLLEDTDEDYRAAATFSGAYAYIRKEEIADALAPLIRGVLAVEPS